MSYFVAVDAADQAVIAIVPGIISSKPHKGIPCRHVSSNNANVCMELERAEERIVNWDGSIDCRYTCSKHLESIDNWTLEGEEVFGFLGARDDTQANHVLFPKA